MKIYRGGAEHKSLEVLHKLKPNPLSWRAEIFRFSAFKEPMVAEDYTDLLLGYVVELLSEKSGYAFVFADGDVLILGQSVFKKTFDQITDNIKSQLSPEDLAKVKEPLSNLYDLSVHIDLIAHMVEKKIAVLMAKPKKPVPAIIPMPDETHNLTPGLIKDNYKVLFTRGLSERKERTKPCVLLVEDDPMSLHLAKRALEKNFTIETASNAAEARIAYLSVVPDIVFLDIGLPDMSGHNLLSELTHLDHEAFVVMLSGNSFQKDIMKSMHMGAKGFIGKPFSRAKLLQYVAQSPHCAHSPALINLH